MWIWQGCGWVLFPLSSVLCSKLVALYYNEKWIEMCFCSKMIRAFNFGVIILCFNTITSLRLLYHSVWKNIGYLNDDFFSLVISVWVFFMASLITFAEWVLITKRLTRFLFILGSSLLVGELFDWEYCVCVGMDTREINQLSVLPVTTHGSTTGCVLGLSTLGLNMSHSSLFAFLIKVF